MNVAPMLAVLVGYYTYRSCSPSNHWDVCGHFLYLCHSQCHTCCLAELSRHCGGSRCILSVPSSFAGLIAGELVDALHHPGHPVALCNIHTRASSSSHLDGVHHTMDLPDFPGSAAMALYSKPCTHLMLLVTVVKNGSHLGNHSLVVVARSRPDGSLTHAS